MALLCATSGLSACILSGDDSYDEAFYQKSPYADRRFSAQDEKAFILNEDGTNRYAFQPVADYAEAPAMTEPGPGEKNAAYGLVAVEPAAPSQDEMPAESGVTASFPIDEPDNAPLMPAEMEMEEEEAAAPSGEPAYMALERAEMPWLAQGEAMNAPMEAVESMPQEQEMAPYGAYENEAAAGAMDAMQGSQYAPLAPSAGAVPQMAAQSGGMLYIPPLDAGPDEYAPPPAASSAAPLPPAEAAPAWQEPIAGTEDMMSGAPVMGVQAEETDASVAYPPVSGEIYMDYGRRPEDYPSLSDIPRVPVEMGGTAEERFQEMEAMRSEAWQRAGQGQEMMSSADAMGDAMSESAMENAPSYQDLPPADAWERPDPDAPNAAAGLVSMEPAPSYAPPAAPTAMRRTPAGNPGAMMVEEPSLPSASYDAPPPVPAYDAGEAYEAYEQPAVPAYDAPPAGFAPAPPPDMPPMKPVAGMPWNPHMVNEMPESATYAPVPTVAERMIAPPPPPAPPAPVMAMQPPVPAVQPLPQAAIGMPPAVEGQSEWPAEEPALPDTSVASYPSAPYGGGNMMADAETMPSGPVTLTPPPALEDRYRFLPRSRYSGRAGRVRSTLY